MPELPEVEHAARALARAATGRRLRAVRTLHPSAARALPPAAAARLAGRRLVAVDRRGKHQLLTLDDGTVLHAHFRMNGDWAVGRTEEELPRHARIVLDFEDGTRVALVDSRALATVRVLGPDDAPLPALGPDANDPEWNGATLHAALATRRAAIKVALLDQRVVAGLGNIYAAEACWQAGVDPRAPANGLTRARCARLVDGARRALADAADDPGRYARGASAGRLAVYGREGEPCLRCEGVVRRIVQAGRSTYFCPRCQRGGRSSR